MTPINIKLKSTKNKKDELEKEKSYFETGCCIISIKHGQ